MRRKRLTHWTALWAAVVLTAPAAYAEGLIGDLQLFAPPRLDAFGGGREASQGFFFCYDQLYWWIQAPEEQFSGPPQDPGDTLGLHWTVGWGERFEFGWIGQHDGIMLSFFNLQPQAQHFYWETRRLSGLPRRLFPEEEEEERRFGFFDYFEVVFYNPEEDSTFRVPFTQFESAYRVKTWGVELEYMRRSHQFRRGGYLEFLAGVRYLTLDDQLYCEGNSPIFGEPTEWRVGAENHLIGPQLGLRYFKLAGRWMLNAEGRFTAGFNSQNVHLYFFPAPGSAYQNMQGHYVAHQNEWAPLVELRLELRYLITKAINLRVGWSGMWMDGLARAPSLNYLFLPNPPLGIDMTNNREDALVHGLTFGVDINR